MKNSWPRSAHPCRGILALALCYFAAGSLHVTLAQAVLEPSVGTLPTPSVLAPILREHGEYGCWGVVEQKIHLRTQAVSYVASDGLPSLDPTSFRNVPRPARDAVKGRGVHFGRPRKLNLEQEKLAQQLISEENQPIIPPVVRVQLSIIARRASSSS